MTVGIGVNVFEKNGGNFLKEKYQTPSFSEIGNKCFFFVICQFLPRKACTKEVYILRIKNKHEQKILKQFFFNFNRLKSDLAVS